MKFTCLRENLSKGLSTVNKAIPVNHTLPILTNVLIVTEDGRLKLAGTDFNTYVVTYVGASVDEDGAITVPAKLLSEFVSHLSTETLSANLKDETFHISADGTKSRFNGVTAEDFPNLPEIGNKTPHIEIEPKNLSNAVSQVGFSVAVDDTRPVFSGILMNYHNGKLTLVGSDGFRLSEIKFNVKGNVDDFSVVIPSRTLLEASKLFSSCEEDIKLYIDEAENTCLFECDDTLLTTRVIDGTYPDYKKIIPSKTEVTAKFSAEELLEAVRLTNVFAKDAENIITLTIDPKGSIKVSSTSKETGSNNTKIKAEVEGNLEKPFEVVFNAKYLLEFLNNNKFEELTFHASEKTTPCLIKPSDKGSAFLHVLAPMQLNT